MYPIRNENHSEADFNSHNIQWIRCETKTAVIPILILAIFSAIRWETRTTVLPILILIVFGVSEKRGPLSYWFKFWLYSVYPRKNEDRSHTDSNCHCIQCNPMGNEDRCHTDFNSHCIQFIRWETRTTVITILILTVFSAIRWETRTTVIPILILNVFCYPIRNEHHSHTDSNSHCIQLYPVGNGDHCHTDSNSSCIQCMQWETGTK